MQIAQCTINAHKMHNKCKTNANQMHFNCDRGALHLRDNYRAFYLHLFSIYCTCCVHFKCAFIVHCAICILSAFILHFQFAFILHLFCIYKLWTSSSSLHTTCLTMQDNPSMLPTLIKESCPFNPWDIQRHDLLWHIGSLVDDPFVTIGRVNM